MIYTAIVYFGIFFVFLELSFRQAAVGIVSEVPVKQLMEHQFAAVSLLVREVLYGF